MSFSVMILRNVLFPTPLGPSTNKLYPFIRSNEALNVSDRKKVFKDIFSAFLYKIAGSILSGTDNILISVLVSTVAVGLYSNYLTITASLEAFIVLLFDSLLSVEVVVDDELLVLELLLELSAVSVFVSGCAESAVSCAASCEPQAAMLKSIAAIVIMAVALFVRDFLIL